MVSRKVFEHVAEWSPDRLRGVLKVVDTIERLIALAMVLIVCLVVVVVVSGCSGNVTANWEGSELPAITLFSTAQQAQPSPAVTVPVRVQAVPVPTEELK